TLDEAVSGRKSTSVILPAVTVPPSLTMHGPSLPLILSAVGNRRLHLPGAGGPRGRGRALRRGCGRGGKSLKSAVSHRDRRLGPAAGGRKTPAHGARAQAQ